MLLTDDEDSFVTNDPMDIINTPAVAAACVIKSYAAKENDEISIEVGDIISVIDIPPPEESVWWRGKRAFQVGYFPAECVEVICDQIEDVFMFLSDTGKFNDPSIERYKKSASIREKSRLGSFSPTFILNRTLRKHTKSDVHRVFGCDLITHLNNTQEELPSILKNCSQFIERHGIVCGIYRLSGVKSNIQKLRTCFDEGKTADFEDESILHDVHCVASLLKMYFRELPNPLLTYQLYDKFVKAIQPNIGNDDIHGGDNTIPESVKLANLRDVIHQLPLPHFRSLEYLMRHLFYISSHAIQTGMTSKNLAIIWAPNLLRSKNLEQQAGVEALHYIGIQAVVTEYLINYVNLLFDRDYYPTSSPPRLPASLRPHPSASSNSRLLTLAEARGRCGHVINPEYETPNDPTNDFEGPSSSGSGIASVEGRKYHTIIDHRPKNVYRDLKKISFPVNYIHAPS